MLFVENLVKNYGSFMAVNNLTLHVPKGDLFGFVGPNGAGKTTTLRCVSGLLRPTSGQISIGSIKAEGDYSEIKRHIGYVPDFFGVYDNFKVSEYLEFYGSLYDMSYQEIRQISASLLELVNLSDKSNEYVDSLSRGMKQRLCVARALLHNPELLILDEPSSGLDPRARIEMKELLMNLQSMGKTIIISSHILSELAEMCNAVGVMNHGQLVAAGKMEDVLQIGMNKNRVTIRVLNGIDVATQVLREYGHISVESVRENEIVVLVNGDETELNHLIRDLIDKGVLLSGFEHEKTDLESIFMQLTGADLREEAN